MDQNTQHITDQDFDQSTILENIEQQPMDDDADTNVDVEVTSTIDHHENIADNEKIVIHDGVIIGTNKSQEVQTSDDSSRSKDNESPHDIHTDSQSEDNESPCDIHTYAKKNQLARYCSLSIGNFLLGAGTVRVLEHIHLRNANSTEKAILGTMIIAGAFIIGHSFATYLGFFKNKSD